MTRSKKPTILLFLVITLLPFIISCEKVVYPGADEIQPTKNHLYVESNPSNAAIYLDNRNSGLFTPDTIKWLGDGKYNVTIKHPFYIDTTVVTLISGGTRASLSIDHTLNPGHLGRLECVCNQSNANIILDDKPVNETTPAILRGIIPGLHKVKVTYPMHRADSIYVAVIGGSIRTALMYIDDTTKGVTYTTTNSPIPSNNTYQIAVDSSNIKWIGTEGEGLIRYDGKNWKVFNMENSSISSNVIKCLFVDSRNKLWIGLDNGLFVYDGNSFMDYSSKLRNKKVTCIVADKKGSIFIGSFGGILKFDGSSWHEYTRENSGLQNELVYAIAVDKENKIWVGTDGYGIAVFDGTSWQKWDMSNMGIGKMIGDVIFSIICDHDGMIWAAHMREVLQADIVKAEGGLSRFDGTKWNVISVPQINTKYILSLNVYRNNNKWVATRYGLGKFDKSNTASIFTNVNAKLQTNFTTATVLDKIGDLYITTVGGGLSKFRRGSF